MWEHVKQAINFTATAVVEETDRSKGYKVMSILLTLVTFAGLFVSTTFGYFGPGWLWVVLFEAALFLIVIIAVHKYHVKTVTKLQQAITEKDVQSRADHKAAVEELSQLYQEGEEITKVPYTNNRRSAECHEWIARGAEIIRRHLGEPYEAEFRAQEEPQKWISSIHYLQPRLTLLIGYMKTLTPHQSSMVKIDSRTTAQPPTHRLTE
jgi:hypothetical protein